MPDRRPLAGTSSAHGKVSAQTPLVSVIVPVRNGERTIGDCIRSILNTDYPPASREIIVVDNASTDQTFRIIERYPVDHLVEARRGPSWARNRGIEASRGDILVFTDADCVVTVGWLRAMVAGFEDPDVGAVAGEVVAYPPRTAVERHAARRRPLWQRAALSSPRPYAVTANVAFRRCVFEAIGLFDPRFLTGQDQELSRRFFAAGLRMRYSRTALVFHRHRDTVWRLFKQQRGWGYGAQLLGNYRPLRESREMLRWLGRCALASLRPTRLAGRSEDAHFAYLEVLRGVARALGALQCATSSTFPLCPDRRRVRAGAPSLRPNWQTDGEGGSLAHLAPDPLHRAT
jgi:glycosyltransferase involved in cell wall biosynthesis